MLKKLYFGGKRPNSNLLSFFLIPFSEFSCVPVKSESIPIFYFKSFLSACSSGHVFTSFMNLSNEFSMRAVVPS